MPDPEDDLTQPQDEVEDETVDRAGGRWSSPLANLGRIIGSTGPVTLPLRGLAHAFTALSYPSFRLVWGGALLSNIGSWMQNIARDWLVYELSGRQEFWLGLNGFAEGVVLIVALPVGGVLADRLDRKTLLIIANLYQAILAASLAVLAASGRLEAWHIVALTAANGLGDALRIPAAQSMMPMLVDRRDLPNAVALGSLQFNISRVIGPMLGGITLKMLGPAWSFGINSASFFASIAALSLIPALPRRKPSGQSALRSLRQAASYVRGRPDLTMMLLMVVTGGLLAAPMMKLLPAYAKHALDGGEATFSAMLSWFGGGAMLGAVLMAARSGRGPTPWRALPMLIGLGAAQIALGFATSRYVAFPLASLMGLLFVGLMVRLNTALLHSSRDELRGRVASFQMLAFRGGVPAGAFLAGILAQATNVRWAFWTFGAGLILAAMVVIALARNIVWNPPVEET